MTPTLVLFVAMAAQAPAQRPRTGHVEANGINYYYEIHGRGRPLLLLHGGLGSIDMFRPILPQLAKEREVIAVDLHGHGRTALGDRPISHVDNGNDLAVVLRKLGYDSVDVMGYSFGGGAALRLAIQHPRSTRHPPTRSRRKPDVRNTGISTSSITLPR